MASVKKKVEEPEVENLPAKTTSDAPKVVEGFENLPSGFENLSITDFEVPYFNILQGLSPQMGTVEGAKLGYIINSGTDELLGTSVNLVTARIEHRWVEWLPNRGGLVAQYPSKSHPVVAKALARVKGNEFEKLITDAGNEIHETYYMDAVHVDDEDFTPLGLARVAFAVTKIKRFKNFLTYASARNAMGYTMPSLIYKWASFKDKNKKGEFYNWKFSLARPTIEESRVMPNSVLYGRVKLVLEHLNDLKVGDEKAGNEGSVPSGADDEIV